jgi:hypothetical protein
LNIGPERHISIPIGIEYQFSAWLFQLFLSRTLAPILCAIS